MEGLSLDCVNIIEHGPLLYLISRFGFGAKIRMRIVERRSEVCRPDG